MAEVDKDRRHIIRRQEDECPHNCIVCYRYNLQMKWVLGGAAGVFSVLVVFSTIMMANMGNIAKLDTKVSAGDIKDTYIIESLNDVKSAMGLKVRMPAKLEELTK